MTRPKLLLAEDKAAQLELWSKILTDEGFLVREAGSTAKARELLESERFDVAVVDLRLRGDDQNDRSGIRLAEDFGSERLPFIIFTGEPKADTVRRALQMSENGGPPAVAVVAKEDGTDALLDAIRQALKPKVFVAHGHDVGTRDEVMRFLERSNLRAVILQAEAGLGQVLIEKFEEHANVEFAVVIITPDDVGRLRNEKRLRHRARQNVVFELGFFLAKVGRRRVVALYKEDGESIELPSNYDGVGMLSMDADGKWQRQLLGQIHLAGIKKNPSR